MTNWFLWWRSERYFPEAGTEFLVIILINFMLHWVMAGGTRTVATVGLTVLKVPLTPRVPHGSNHANCGVLQDLAHPHSWGGSAVLYSRKNLSTILQLHSGNFFKKKNCWPVFITLTSSQRTESSVPLIWAIQDMHHSNMHNGRGICKGQISQQSILLSLSISLLHLLVTVCIAELSNWSISL